MRRVVFVFLLLQLVSLRHAVAQSHAYTPLSTWSDDYTVWVARLNSLNSAGDRRATNIAPRPMLAGAFPQDVELLQDAMLRKHPRMLRNDPAVARRLVERRYRAGVNGRNQLHGAMAEAIFVSNHPEWGYVAKPNASQHDVYRRQAGSRPPLTGQVKFHRSGNPSIYAQDMVEDFRAHRFLVPDDHVEPLRRYWLNAYHRSLREGNPLQAQYAARHAGRVQGLGATSEAVVTATRTAFQFCAAESRAVYFSLGAALAMALGETSSNLIQGEAGRETALQTARSTSILSAGLGADAGLRHLRQGTLRGTFKGNVICGTAMLILDTCWNIHEHGGLRAAVRNRDFYAELAGSTSGVALGGLAMMYVGTATSGFGPVVALPSTIVAGTVVGCAGYVGGQAIAEWMIHRAYPGRESIDRLRIEAARAGLLAQLQRAQMPLSP